MTFDEVEQLLAAAPGSDTGAAELHGRLSGYVAGRGAVSAEAGAAAQDWLQMHGSLAPALAERVDGWLAHVGQALGDDELGFYPLLPDDQAPLAVRLRELGCWCRGFLSSLGQAAIPGLLESAEVQEALADVAAIADVSCDVEEDVSAEQDYAEVVEHVRLVVLTIHAEARQDAASAPSGSASSAP